MNDLYFGLSKINNNVISILEDADNKSDNSVANTTSDANIDRIFSNEQNKEQWKNFITDGKTPDGQENQDDKNNPKDSSTIDSNTKEVLNDADKLVVACNKLNDIQIKLIK